MFRAIDAGSLAGPPQEPPSSAPRHNRKRNRWPRILARASTVLGGLWLVVSPVAAAPLLQFQPKSIAGTGITPNGRAVFFCVAREQKEWMDHTVGRLEVAVDSDGDGVVSIPPSGSPTERSVWALVDVSSGTFSIDAPSGYQPMPASNAPSIALRSDTFEDQRTSLHLLVIRPGVGAWTGRLFDGTSGDLGPASDGRVLTRTSSLSLVPNSAPSSIKPPQLGAFQAGDVILGIDPVHLEYFTLTLAASRS